jgi:signal transduction histidine kinase
MLKSQWFIKYKKQIMRCLRVIFALAIAVVIYQLNLDYVESWTYDLRVRYQRTLPPSGHVQLVAIDAETLRDLGRDPHATDHTMAMMNLLKAQPQAIVYTFSPSEIVGSFDELKEFGDLASHFTNFYYAWGSLPKKGGEQDLRLPAPLDDIQVVPGPATHDYNVFPYDNVTRRMILDSEGIATLHTRLANLVTGRSSWRDYRGTFDYLESKQAYINYRPRNTYATVSFKSLVNNDFNPADFKGRIVLIGRDTLENSLDYVSTPYAKNAVGMTTLEMHANMLDTLIENRAPVRTPPWLNLLLTVLISLLTLYVVTTVRPTEGLILIVLTLLTFVFVCHGLFSLGQIWVEMSHPLLAIFICYYFFIPYRLIMENRKSWEYYQRNRLLTQVEELKSNFLRMMSHDLKTPLARIQGMADVVITDSNPLSQGQASAIRTIRDSSRELSDFIGSILNLSRIESKHIKLHLKSRDINQVLENVIHQCDYLAKKKNIEILTEFDPLFSLKVDEDLLKQAFMNLVENGIKYSPENSKILISTEESGSTLVVQVADQGRGIADEEIPHIFHKFYRSWDVQNSAIKGSGLGLFLAKYFVELHRGRIEVESQLGKGSTFTVFLPNDLKEV